VRRISAIAVAVLALLALAIEPALAAAAKPKPKLARTVVLKPAGGSVLVKPRGGKRFKLKKTTAVKVGSTVDTTRGKVKLTSARSSKRTQSGEFSKGAFVVTQQKDGLTDLKLTGGDFGVCTAAAKAKRPVSGAANTRRRLFGTAHGRFRTRGRNSSATVRGTTWLTEDNCDGTATENQSSSPASKIETKSSELEFSIDPGQTITYYCNRFEVQPDTYCLMLLAQPADGVIGAGIITQIDVPDYALCVHRPDGGEGCSVFPLSERDEQGWRLSALACPVAGPGEYFVGWSLDKQSFLYPVLSLSLDVAGPAVDCQSQPPVAPPAS
jgi:hypothetical protein